MSDILLLEPAYKNKYPPIGLMKISYFHRYIHHDFVRFAKGELPKGFENKKWDRVYVTTLFTFEWDMTKEAIRYALSVVKPEGNVYTGGILATLRPEWISSEFPMVINNPGLLNREGTLGLAGEECVDTLPLDYGILKDIEDEYVYPAHDAYFTYMTRGCGMNCTFCAVKTLEPTYNPYVTISESIRRIDKEFGPKKDLLLMDNNVLRSPKFDQIVDEIKSLGFQKGATFVNPKTQKVVERHVDFNQGLDAFLLTEHKAKRLGELAIKPARIAFDHIEDEEAYVKAITLCAKAGIDHMSNYLLYNGVDFKGKGHSYKADTPEDLYYRMHLTMELAEKLTKELDRKISIFSFPMRYIPLEANKRGFIGTNWNAKYLRAFQCMLIPTQGKGIQGRSFFEADFGRNEKEFVEFLAMPESLLNKRGHFVERKNEDKAERLRRRTEWEENQTLIMKWRSLYNTLDKEIVYKYISPNRFNARTLDNIESVSMQKLYVLYLTPAGFIRVFSECSEHTCEVVKEFVIKEIPFLYKRIVKHASHTSLTPKLLAGLVHSFGKDILQQLVRNIDFFDESQKRKIDIYNRTNHKYQIVDFDFSLLGFLSLYNSAGVLTFEDREEIKNAIFDFNEDRLRNLLLNKLEDLKVVLIKTNDSEVASRYLADLVEEQISKVYKQLSLFD